MKKAANLKNKMSATPNGERSTSSFDLPQVRSSTELLKQFQIKREKINSNLEGPINNQHIGKRTSQPSFGLTSKEQFKLSNFAATSQASENSNNVKREHLETQPSVQNSTRQPMRKPVVEVDNSKAKQQSLEKRGPEYDNTMKMQQSLKKTVAKHDTSKANQQLMKRVDGEGDNSNTKQQPLKKTVTEYDNSMARQQPLRRTMATNDNSSANQQPMKRLDGEGDKSKTKQQPFKKTVTGFDNSIARQQPHMKKTVVEDADSRSKQPHMKRAMVEDDDNSRIVHEGASKKAKRIPMCRSTLIEEFLKENGEVGEEEEELRNESLGEEEEEDLLGEEESTEQMEDDETNGTSKKRTRGPTKCLKIHSRKNSEREEVVLDNDGEPIGPNDQTVSDLSYFLGTIARNSDMCPLIYTNFRALVKDNGDDIWEFVNDKFIISDKGRKAVFSRINDAWRRYKRNIKKNCFLKYSTMRDRLKHRPPTVPEAHFKQLVTYWKSSTIQRISQINAMNRAKQKYMHRMGPKNFARIRAQLRAKKDNGLEVSQAEMFIETRQSRKGKQVDEETQIVIDKLQDSIQNSSESETFKSLFGKEKPGRVRCYGKTATPSMLKRNEEMSNMQKQHSNEMNSMKREMDGLKSLVRNMMKQQNPNLSEEELANMMAAALGSDNSAAPHSSASTHNPHLDEENEEEVFQEGVDELGGGRGGEEEEEEEYDA